MTTFSCPVSATCSAVSDRIVYAVAGRGFDHVRGIAAGGHKAVDLAIGQRIAGIDSSASAMVTLSVRPNSSRYFSPSRAPKLPSAKQDALAFQRLKRGRAAAAHHEMHRQGTEWETGRGSRKTSDRPCLRMRRFRPAQPRRATGAGEDIIAPRARTSITFWTEPRLSSTVMVMPLSVAALTASDSSHPI